jgi:glycosyltransferase 2 family protein
MATSRGLGRSALGLAISVVALVLVFRSVDVASAWDTLKGAQLQWVVLLVLLVIGDVVLRALRWQVLLLPLARVSYRDTQASLLVGYLANNVLPARLGEVVRSHDFGERTGISRTTILGTIVIERVVDTMVVVSIAAVAILVLSVRGIVASAVLVGFAVTALLVVAIAVGMAAHRLPGAERVRTFLGRWPRVRHLLSKLRVGLSVVSDPRSMTLAVILSIASWSLTVLAFAAAAQAVGVQPTIGQAALLAAGTNLATAIPAAPGYVGTFELAVVTIAASVGIPRESALAFGILTHVAILAVTSIGGAAVLVMGSGRRRGRAAARAFSVASEDAAGAASDAASVDVPSNAPDPASAPVTTRGET